jgi:hypothetical protein
MSGSGRTFAMLIKAHPLAIRRIATQLRRLVLDSSPGLVENVYGSAKVGIALYSVGGETDVLCGIQPRDDSCLLYVHNVTETDSIALKLQGKGEDNRHVKFGPKDRLPELAVRNLLRLARDRMPHAT